MLSVLCEHYLLAFELRTRGPVFGWEQRGHDARRSPRPGGSGLPLPHSLKGELTPDTASNLPTLVIRTVKEKQLPCGHTLCARRLPRVL